MSPGDSFVDAIKTREAERARQHEACSDCIYQQRPTRPNGWPTWGCSMFGAPMTHENAQAHLDWWDNHVCDGIPVASACPVRYLLVDEPTEPREGRPRGVIRAPHWDENFVEGLVPLLPIGRPLEDLPTYATSESIMRRRLLDTTLLVIGLILGAALTVATIAVSAIAVWG